MVVHTSRARPSWVQLFGISLTVTISFALLAVLVAVVNDLPVRDPDGLFGPSWVRLPLIVAGMVAADFVPRAVVQARRGASLRDAVQQVFTARWPRNRLAVVAAGLATFYLAYVAYRNLKSFLPFVRRTLEDKWLLESDEWLTFGNHPGDLLHELLGTGLTAEALSSAYIFFLFFVPFSLAASLVWSNDLARGAWYVNALSFNWILGTASYYALPSLGPIYVERFRFEDLPPTGVSGLQRSLLNNRVDVMADPHATQAVHGIAAFASLHVSIVFTAALVAHLVRMPALLRAALWLFVLLTVLATVYFGWHYVLDVIAGFALGGVAVWLARLATPGRSDPPAPAGEPPDDERVREPATAS